MPLSEKKSFDRQSADVSLLQAFNALDLDHDGRVSSQDLLRAYSGQSSVDDKSAIEAFLIAQAGSNTISFGQFCQLLDAYGLQVLPRGPSLSSTALESNLAGLLRDLAISEAQELEDAKQSNITFLSYQYWTEEFDWTVIKHLIAGGVAGGVSRTVVSPFERMKILFQIQGPNKSGYNGVWGTLSKIWREEGVVGYLRGNGTNVIRIVPYSAVQFAAYEHFKNILLAPGAKDLDTPRRLTAGALAGITSVICTYPLDIVRTRLSVQSANLGQSSSDLLSKAKAKVSESPLLSNARGLRTSSLPACALPGIWGTLKIMYLKEGGVRALYQGLGPTLMGVAPYVALNFQSYEVLRAHFTPPGESSPSGVHKLACGAMAGTIAQTFTYPLDVLRRRMQVNGLSDMLGYKYRNTLHAATEIVNREGVRGLYKGMIPNYLKVAPAIGVSFYTYELCKTFLDV
ncbi:hypothetical protein DSO57_1021519 [Entomophthora muscae]|uniref:Uncharacterized protein n=1 Tax=Entomophthora muscae TaxID=34485 RepID=A0ACC2TR03_9FUNG|nr:hypothetical protein DSO57_1021519 [Entomophthora muscae]